MASYTAIADFGDPLVNLLRSQMANVGIIELCGSAQRKNVGLSVYLYDTAEEWEYTSRMIQLDATR